MHLQTVWSCLSAACAVAGVAVPVLRQILKARRNTLVSDLPDSPVVVAPAPPAVVVPAADPGAPIATAPAAPAVNSSAVVSSVVQAVSSHPAVASSDAPSVIASILAGLYQAEPVIFAATRASAKTQGEVGLGLGLAEVIVSAFLHPAG